MSNRSGNFDDFGMDTITMNGPLDAKLQAMRDAGFSQVMLKSSDLVGHAGGVADAVRVVKASGLRVTGFQVLRDFEDEAVAVVLGLQRVQNGGQCTIKLNVHDGADDLRHLTYSLGCRFYHCHKPRFISVSDGPAGGPLFSLSGAQGASYHPPPKATRPVTQ